MVFACVRLFIELNIVQTRANCNEKLKIIGGAMDGLAYAFLFQFPLTPALSLEGRGGIDGSIFDQSSNPASP